MTPTELETLSKANVTAMDPKELVTLLRRTSLAAQPGLSVLSQEVAPTTIAVAPDALKDASDRLMVMPPPAAQSASQISMPPGKLVEENMVFNSRGSLVMDNDEVFLTTALPHPQATFASETPEQPPLAEAPANSLSDRLQSMLFAVDQFPPASEHDILPS